MEEALCFTVDSVIYSADEVKDRKIERLEERIRQRRTLIQVLEAVTALDHKRFAYWLWQKDCQRYFAKKNWNIFIDLPEPTELCTDRGCLVRKGYPTSINLCKHDLASVYQGAGKNILELLKTDRLKWHPDTFARNCDSAVKTELADKAKQIFTIMGEVMDDEAKKGGKENARP
jgi:hypothetical protein